MVTERNSYQDWGRSAGRAESGPPGRGGFTRDDAGSARVPGPATYRNYESPSNIAFRRLRRPRPHAVAGNERPSPRLTARFCDGRRRGPKSRPRIAPRYGDGPASSPSSSDTARPIEDHAGGWSSHCPLGLADDSSTRPGDGRRTGCGRPACHEADRELLRFRFPRGLAAAALDERSGHRRRGESRASAFRLACSVVVLDQAAAGS